MAASHRQLNLGPHGPVEGFGGPAPSQQYAPSLEVEPQHLEIRLDVDLDGQVCAGNVATIVTGRRDTVRRLELDAVGFQKLSVKDDSGAPLEWSYDGRKIRICWEEGFKKGETRVLRIVYQVRQPKSGLFFMKPTTLYPKRAYYAATDHETELARYWLPCIDHPRVRPTAEFWITAREDLTILANGVFKGEERHGNGTKTAHWRLEQRCPSYLLCFAVGEFVRWHDGEFEGIPLAYFACKDFTPADLERSFGRTRAMLAWMTKKLGVAFPYPKYYQFAVPFFGGAMENISLVSWSDRFVLTERSAPEWTWLVDQINVHEMAHSYFGDLVGCSDYAHVWLKESWATYIETCWLEDSKGDDEKLYDLYRNAESYVQEADDDYRRPLVTRTYTSSWQMFDRHLYPGGACRLHTLRCEVGDDVFWAAVTDYIETFRETSVETGDFRRIMEKHSGRSLDKFFDQWVHTPAYPDLKVSFSYDQETRQGSFKIEQKQVNKEKNIPAFEFRTEIGWTVDGKDRTMPIHVFEQVAHFTVPMEKEPSQVRFDPAWKVLCKLDFEPGDDKLKAQLTSARDVVGRIHAAKVLAASGKRPNQKAVIDAYRHERFWGVRREMIKALAGSKTEEALTAMVGFIREEQDPLVLDRVFEGAAAFRDDRIKEAIEARLACGDLGPLAVSRAYEALGAQRERAPFQLLLAAALKGNDQSDVEQVAALRALGSSRMRQAAEVLAKASEYGETAYRSRHGAVAGLGMIARYLEHRERATVVERLVDLLRDPDEWVRLAAASSLKMARDKGAIPALEAYRATLPLQIQVEVDKWLAELRSSEDPKVKGLEKELEELQTKYRQLQDRLLELESKVGSKMSD